MLYTEQEAKEKLCPQKAVECSRRNGDYIDSGRTVWAEFGKCEGSKCMAWHYYGSGTPFSTLHDGDYLMSNGEIIDAKDVPSLYGYCGLAGKPRGCDHA